MRIHLVYAEDINRATDDLKDVPGIEITHLAIIEEEEAFAKAKLEIIAENGAIKSISEKEVAVIARNGANVDVLLRGFPVLLSMLEESGIAIVEIIARPAQYEEGINKLKQNQHPLFPDAAPSSIGFVDKSFYCNRITHKIDSSPWYGKHDVELNGEQFVDGFKAELVSDPISQVEIQLSTQWLQQINGFFDLGHQIRKKLTNSDMLYNSPISLKKSWPRSGKRMGKTGYWVVKSDFKSIPVKTKSDKTEFGQLGTKIGNQGFRQYKHSMELVLGWLYKQKRVEAVSFRIKNGISEVFPNYKNSKTLKIRLKNPFPIWEGHPWLPGTIYNEESKAWHEGALYKCKHRHCSGIDFKDNIDDWQVIHTISNANTDSGKFFDTALGQDAISYAIKMACWHLSKSSRIFKTTFELSFEAAQKLSVNNILKITDPRLPNGEIIGKIVSLRLLVDPDKNLKLGRVKILSAIGNGNKNQDLEKIVFEKVKMLGEVDGISAKPDQILSRLDVRDRENNLPEVKVELLDIRTSDKFTRSINIEEDLIWSSPKQI